MARFDDILARIDGELAGDQTTWVQDNNDRVFFDDQTVVREQPGFTHIAADYSRVFADAQGTIGIGHEAIATHIAATQPITINAEGATADIAIYGSAFDDVINATNGNIASPSMTLYAMYRVIRDDSIDGVSGAEEPDADGFNYWQNQFEAGMPMSEIAKIFLTYVPNWDFPDNANFATTMYREVLGREPEEGAVDNLVNHINGQLAQGIDINTVRANVFQMFVNSSENLISRGIGRDALNWADNTGFAMGPSLDVFAGEGNDIIYATRGNNNIDTGNGNDTVYLPTIAFGTTNINNIQGFETIQFLADRPETNIVNVAIFGGEGDASTVRLTTDLGAVINIFGDKYIGDRVAYSFGQTAPGAGSAVEVNGTFNAQTVMNNVLDFDAPEAFVVDPSLFAQDNTPIVGTPGNDTINGNDLNDTITAGDGNDVVNGRAGNDALFGNQGDDALYGNQGADSVHGGQGNDLIHGGQDNDTIHGDLGDDNLWGDLGDDRIADTQGFNEINGGDGSDTIVFAGGTDVWGGNQADTFGYDFSVGEDQRGTIGDYESGDMLRVLGLKPDDKIAVKVFEDGNTLQLSANGKTLDVFAKDEYTIDQIVARLNNGNQIAENEVLEREISASDFNETFSTSMNGENVAEPQLIGVNPQTGTYDYTFDY